MAARWVCEVCGYVHEGDAPPEECPICGVGPDQFSPHQEAAASATGSAPPGRWRCTVCDYVHEGGAPPDECPVCGVDASLFVAAEASEQPAASSVVPGAAGRLVIVGAGVAGVTAAEHARRQSAELEIVLVHKEPDLPYNRLNLTRLIAGEVDPGRLDLRRRSWYQEQRIELLDGEAARVDLETRQVELASGERVGFSRLVLANGSHPFIPPIQGGSREGVMPLRTLGHVGSLLERTGSDGRCVVIGGGLLGLETAGGLARRGVEVTVLEGFDWLLPRQLAPPAGKLLEQAMAAAGVEVVCGVKVAAIDGDEAVRAVRLEDGRELPAHVVVLSTGVRPNSYLARQCGLEVQSGIVVDDRMQTSAAEVFAAGDVAEHRGRVYGLWPVALAQGRVAGTNAAGGQASFAGMPPAAQLKVLDVDMFSIGDFMPSDAASKVVERHGEATYLRLVCRDGALVGGNLYGDLSLAGEIRSAVESRAQVADSAKLLEAVPELAVGIG
jgi:nitrite reductase (NADH) large subunit